MHAGHLAATRAGQADVPARQVPWLVRLVWLVRLAWLVRYCEPVPVRRPAGT